MPLIRLPDADLISNATFLHSNEDFYFKFDKYSKFTFLFDSPSLRHLEFNNRTGIYAPKFNTTKPITWRMSNSSSTFLLARINNIFPKNIVIYIECDRETYLALHLYILRETHIYQVCVWGTICLTVYSILSLRIDGRSESSLGIFITLHQYVEAILNIKHGVIVKRESWNQFPTLKTRSTKDGTVTVSKGFKLILVELNLFTGESKVIMKLLL